MKRFYSKFRIGLITFAFGLASVWLFENKEQNKNFLTSSNTLQNLAHSNSKTSGFLSTQSSKRFGWRGFTERSDCFKTIKYKCENGFRGIYWQTGANGTALDKNIKIISGFYNIEPQQFKQEIASSEILEKNERFKDDFTEGIRIILKKEINNKEFYEILYYDEKEAQYYISAPTLQLALEFEQWQNDFNSRK